MSVFNARLMGGGHKSARLKSLGWHRAETGIQNNRLLLSDSFTTFNECTTPHLLPVFKVNRYYCGSLTGFQWSAWRKSSCFFRHDSRNSREKNTVWGFTHKSVFLSFRVTELFLNYPLINWNVPPSLVPLFAVAKIKFHLWNEWFDPLFCNKTI